MRIRDLALSATVALAVGWFGHAAFSDDPPKEPPKEDPGAEWMKWAAPGEEHARLKALAGEWTVHGTFSSEDGSVAESDSTASMTMILGDRYLQQTTSGTIGGGPFEGRLWIGYDKGSKRWVSAWIDNWGTGILVGDGEETEKGKSWTFKSTFHGPKGDVAMKDVLTLVSEKELTWNSYTGGSDKPMVSLVYKRK